MSEQTMSSEDRTKVVSILNEENVRYFLKGRGYARGYDLLFALNEAGFAVVRTGNNHTITEE